MTQLQKKTIYTPVVYIIYTLLLLCQHYRSSQTSSGCIFFVCYYCISCCCCCWARVSFWLYPLVYYSVGVRLLFAYWIIGARVTLSLSHMKMCEDDDANIWNENVVSIIHKVDDEVLYSYIKELISLFLFYLANRERAMNLKWMCSLLCTVLSVCVYKARD